MNFKIGEKVVCVNNIYLEPEKIEVGIKAPLKNEIYTIRSINDYDAIMVEEIINPICKYGNSGYVGENSFYLHHFRKLDYDFADNLLAEISESFKILS